MIRIYLALGTNIGNREENLKKALTLLQNKNIKILKKSSVYETEPFGSEGQNFYLNQVIEGMTEYRPEELLKIIKEIEKDMGRKKRRKWGSREIDIDILFYDNKIIRTENLVIPHKHLHKRQFVLVPLAEIASLLIHPVFKKNVRELLMECTDKLELKKLR